MAGLCRLTITTAGRIIFNKSKNELTHFQKSNVRTIVTSIVQLAPMDKPLITIQEVKEKLEKLMGVESGYKPIQESRSHLLRYLPQSQEELESRSMQDSFTSALIPLSTEGHIQDRYVTFLGSVRIGRLLEDMDIFAVWVVHKHIKNPRQKPDMPSCHNLVTVLVDKIDFTDFKPTPTDDIRLSGHVSWVGKSSVEVVVWLEQMRHGQWHKITRALFLMAARDATHAKAAYINAIQPADEEEKKIFSGGEIRRKHRIMVRNQSLLKMIPTDEEQKIIHDLFIRTMHSNEISLLKRSLPKGCAWMEEAALTNVIFSQPENRNLHNNVFGGFLMRQATELSWALVYIFSKYQPKLKHISDINFHKPVEVNSLIRMQAHVVYTTMQFLQITVYAESYQARTGGHNTTNEFHFTYELPELATEVFPQTYHDAMMYLDGRRHFLYAMSLHVDDSTISPKM